MLNEAKLTEITTGEIIWFVKTYQFLAAGARN
jgi:hypothetical protein